MRYIEKYDYLVKKYPELPVFDDCSRRITFKELDERSSKIYARLKKLGISREDFVTILLPRSVDIVAAIIGVIKAGAAFVTLEDTYPEERVAYISKDVGTKLTLDKKLLEDIYHSEEGIPGHEETDVHDAAYAVYTSGSTGNPKGVLHEYGNIDQLLDTTPETPDYNIGMPAPAYFVVFTMTVLRFMTRAYTTWIIPLGIVRDQIKYERFILDHKLDAVFMPPSQIRLYKEPSPFLKRIYTGSEPANGLYFPGGKPEIINAYSMSEAGFVVLETLLDKKYDIAPVGKPVLDDNFFHILDEDGNVVEGEGKGELCFKNEFVRGYINLPEKTKEVFVNGIYHTRDIVRKDKDGRYYIVGRIDDMIKINGNRVEPAEIEAVIKRLTGLKSVVAKGFDTDGRQFICLYYLRSEAEELGILKDGTLVYDKEKLGTMLPLYMHPSYYICMEKFPKNANNKIAKILLEAPDVSDFRKEYKAPLNETEEFFCKAFEKVLGITMVSRDDDFFLIGGDSIRAIRLVSECEGYDITSKDLQKFRTPELLAENAKKNEGVELSDYSERMSTGYHDENISGMAFYGAFVNNVTSDTVIMLKKEADVPLIEKALFTVYRNYPFYHQHLEAENGKLYYVRDVEEPKVYTPEMSVDREDRIRVIADGKKLLVKIPHSFTDGFGMHLFLQLFLGTYQELLDGKAPDLQKEEVYTPGHYYEIFSEDYSAYGKEVPEVYKNVVGAYRFPEAPDEKEKDTGKRYHYTVKIKLDKLPALSAEQSKELSSVGGGATVVVADMIAKAIKDIHPDAEKIGCRTSVNLRSIMKHEDSLKNMSMGLAVFFPGEDGFQQLTEALTPEVLKWQLMKFRLMIDGKLDAPEDKMLIGSIINTTFAVTNMIGNGQKTPYIVESIESENASPVPLLVMIGNEGNEISISFIQKFESRIYFDRFCEILSEYDR